jgi:hypothetical protein
MLWTGLRHFPISRGVSGEPLTVPDDAPNVNLVAENPELR